MPALLAIAAACTFGVADFLGGLATRKTAVVAVTLFTNLTGAALAIALVVAIDGTWSLGAIGWGAASGLAGLGGLVLLYQGLADGPNRLVSPLSAVVAATVPVIVGVTLGDRPTAIAIAGICVVPAAVWLVAGGDITLAGASRRPLALSVGAGLGFGTFFVLLAQTPDDAGAVPLLTARATSVTVLLAATFITRPPTPAPSTIGLAVAAGAIDMTANGLFLWSTLDGDLAIVGALVSLFPATTVLLAVIFLNERPTVSKPSVWRSPSLPQRSLVEALKARAPRTRHDGPNMYTPPAFEMSTGPDVTQALRRAVRAPRVPQRGDEQWPWAGRDRSAVRRRRRDLADPSPRRQSKPHWRHIDGQQALLIVPIVDAYVSPRCIHRKLNTARSCQRRTTS
ncbi:MAG: DMT family transporter [Acidimicrobiales bacterium]